MEFVIVNIEYTVLYTVVLSLSPLCAWMPIRPLPELIGIVNRGKWL